MRPEIITDMLQHLGSDATEEMVREHFAGLSTDKIKKILDDMWPPDDEDEESKNMGLAETIYCFCKTEGEG